MIDAPAHVAVALDRSAFDSLSAHASARALAEALDRACARRAA
jgi:hypothetical protein